MSGASGDPGAQSELAALLHSAAASMAGLNQPAVVAASPNKHDDTGRFPNWLAAQIGRAFWERTDYRVEHGDVHEKSRNPEDLAASRDILDRLQTAGWRRLAERALGLQLTDEVLGLVSQHEARFLLISGTQRGMDAAFLVGQRGDLDSIGAAHRLDHRVGRDTPLLFKRIDPDAWPRLHKAVPAFPVPALVRRTDADAEDARTRLADIVRAAFARLQALPGSIRYVATAAIDPDGGYFRAGGWRAIGTEEIHEIRGAWGGYHAQYAQRIERLGPVAQALDAVAVALEAAKWRDQFFRSVTPLSPLALLIRGPDAWIIGGETSVFALQPDGALTLVGACDSICSAWGARRAVVHLFDGRSIPPPA